MFFIFGISSGKKRLDFNQTMICPNCGHFGRLEVYMTYMYFSLFFIPLFKWGKRYLVKTSCCNGVCDIPNELGKRIEKGQTIEIDPKDLNFPFGHRVFKQCTNCGFSTSEEFEYCPKCGKPL